MTHGSEHGWVELAVVRGRGSSGGVDCVQFTYAQSVTVNVTVLTYDVSRLTNY